MTKPLAFFPPPPFAMLVLGLLLSPTGCATLNYPESEPVVFSSPSSEATPPAVDPAIPADPAPVPTNASRARPAPTPKALPSAAESAAPAPGTAYGIPEPLPVDETADESLEWHELTRLARAHRLQGEFVEANTRLRQAALQLDSLPPGSASRRAVFSQRARLARELFRAGETETAELLAGELFAEAEEGPAIGGASLIDLARDSIERRAQDAEGSFSEEEELSLLALAFRSSQTGTATRARVNLGFEVASLALHLGQVELARDAIDQAVLDARTTNPLDRDQEASLKVYKSRIALAQGDLRTAEAAAVAATRIFDELDANSSSRGVGEATLADVLTVKGETDRALELARGAYARRAEGSKLYDHALRTIIASLARAESAAGLTEEASRHYREALAIPVEKSALDERLSASIRREFDALDQRP